VLRTLYRGLLYAGKLFRGLVYTSNEDGTGALVCGTVSIAGRVGGTVAITLAATGIGGTVAIASRVGGTIAISATRTATVGGTVSIAGRVGGTVAIVEC
jgi:hypothetical protein